MESVVRSQLCKKKRHSDKSVRNYGVFLSLNCHVADLLGQVVSIAAKITSVVQLHLHKTEMASESFNQSGRAPRQMSTRKPILECTLRCSCFFSYFPTATSCLTRESLSQRSHVRVADNPIHLSSSNITVLAQRGPVTCVAPSSKLLSEFREHRNGTARV